MRSIISLITLVTVLGCNYNDNENPSGLDANTMGYVMELPFSKDLSLSHFPPGTKRRDHYKATFFSIPKNSPSRKIDFGGEMFLDYIVYPGAFRMWKEAAAPPHAGEYWLQLRHPLGSKLVLMSMMGTVSGDENAKVRSTISFSPGSFFNSDFIPEGMLTLRLSIKQGDSWVVIKSYSAKHRARSFLATWAVESSVPDGSVVKTELVLHATSRINEGNAEPRLRLRDARMFGAKCFPDLVNDGKCL